MSSRSIWDHKNEVQKCCDFFNTAENQLQIRIIRVKEGLKHVQKMSNDCSRLMVACVRLYKDLLLLENYAIINYCGFSKILKKHDKLTKFFFTNKIKIK